MLPVPFIIDGDMSTFRADKQWTILDRQQLEHLPSQREAQNKLQLRLMSLLLLFLKILVLAPSRDH